MRKNWSREETILALELYYKIPFSRIDAEHREVMDLARLIGRSGNAVALKMFNIGACDPVHKERGVRSMSHISKMDILLFDEFYGRWEELAFTALIIRAEMENRSIESYLIDAKNLPTGDDRLSEVRVRIGQDFFRKAVLAAYGGKCCVTGIDNSQILIASHIKPWKVSSPIEERTNP